MHIDIAQRLRPFSHTPGTRCLLPGTLFVIEIFPCLIRVYDLTEASLDTKAEIPINVKGPVTEFTITLDLERAWIMVEGKSTEGFFRYRIQSNGILVVKSPVENLFPQPSPLLPSIRKESMLPSLPLTDRLSLGNHKAQDWDLIRRRLDLTEIFPIWNRLAQLIPLQTPIKPYRGTATLLTACEESIASRKPEHLLPAFKNLFMAAFHHLLVPSFHDDQHQGLVPSIDSETAVGNPLFLLQEGAALIRRLFIDIHSDHISILPALPPEFHCGRWLHIALPQEGYLDLEWSKKTIRRVIIRQEPRAGSGEQEEGRQMLFRFPSGIKSFRLRSGMQDRGQRVTVNTPIFINRSQQYFFDNFH